MHWLHRIAAVGFLSLSFVASPAAAFPVEVTYDFGPGGFIGWGVGSPTASGVAGAQLKIVYDDGSPLIGGFLASPATLKLFQVTFTSPGTLMGDPVTAIAVGSGAVGTVSVGGFWNFAGPTGIAASALGPAFPTYSQVGTAFLLIDMIGASTISFGGGGTQMFLGPSLTASWTSGGLVGMEVSRTIVPEPRSGALLALGFAMLGVGSWRMRMRKR